LPLFSSAPWGLIVAQVGTQDERNSPAKAAGTILGFCGVLVVAGGGGGFAPLALRLFGWALPLQDFSDASAALAVFCTALGYIT
jgi:drug/metabolite transporter (DMT)-like permease